MAAGGGGGLINSQEAESDEFQGLAGSLLFIQSEIGACGTVLSTFRAGFLHFI